MFGGVLLFHPCWVVSSALAGLASGFGMGPGVSLPLWTAVTLFTLSVVCFGGGVGIFRAGRGEDSTCCVCGVWLRGIHNVLVVCKFSAG